MIKQERLCKEAYRKHDSRAELILCYARMFQAAGTVQRIDSTHTKNKAIIEEVLETEPTCTERRGIYFSIRNLVQNAKHAFAAYELDNLILKTFRSYQDLKFDVLETLEARQEEMMQCND